MVLMQWGCSQDHYYYKNDKKVPLIAQTNNSNEVAKVYYYKNEKGILLGVTNKIIVKVTDERYLNQYIQEFNLSIEKKLSKNLYLLKVLEKNKTLDIANSLNQKEGITYAHPDFIKKRILR